MTAEHAVNEDLRPFLLCLPEGASARCATWQLELGGHESLALFTSADAAETYRQVADLTDDWMAVQPGREALAEIFRDCYQTQSIQFAVLDPVRDYARRIFELRPMMQQLQAKSEKDSKDSKDS